MLDRLVGIILTAVGCFGSLMAIVFEFFRVHPEGKRTVSPRTMGLILSCLLLACIGGATLADYYNEGGFSGIPASTQPSVPQPPPSYEPQSSPSQLVAPSPSLDVQVSEPAETTPLDSQPPDPSVEPSSPMTKAPPPSPTTPPQTTFMLEAFNDISYATGDFHLEYHGPDDKEFVVDRFPLELPMVPGYYYVKIHRDGTCQELARASFYVDDSVAGYAIGFRRILKWGLYDARDVDEDCLLCSWGYSPLPAANLCLTLVDGAQYSAHGLEVRIHCDDFDSDVFCCIYHDDPLWFSLPPGYDYSVTVDFDIFVAAEGSFQITAPQDGTAPQTLELQLA